MPFLFVKKMLDKKGGDLYEVKVMRNRYFKYINYKLYHGVCKWNTYSNGLSIIRFSY